MKKSTSVILLITIVVLVVAVAWKFGIPYLNQGQKTSHSPKVVSVAKVSSPTKPHSHKSSMRSFSSESSVVSSESTRMASSSSVTSNLAYPELAPYAGVTYYAQGRKYVEFPQMFPTSFTISTDGQTVNINGEQKQITGVTNDHGYITLTDQINVICAFRDVGTGQVEMINQGQKLDYSTTMGD
ncbi:hypothetical protein [Ligilactobacillus equi]|nr:hypothetical protein [Ligilactobacillus equi]